ncbi:ABC transporter substrate-binding protein [Cellulomonas oligotrophica]|uniref:Multiple sugar transport system substrate-binding protein n=1 Tax=Cellulomonas oligotrophica TaxID=931536 RepID=A0A7Y9JX61_9CELL|nr:sugar ABC transporter substrate-binding protein [Cellulomonas oligotrophica]NYD85596.1 multiple sugar transport system substrate-binding protein [Cellulomonas oligotrophica]GIG31395.1 sugar ABC transporter substrate-binding protein [Cellulomonas oligotrophica]
MKRTRLAAGALCVAMAGALTLTACSGDSGDDGTKTLTFMFRGGPDEKAAYEAAIDRYTEATGVEVEMIVTDADQYATKLQAAVAGNNVPDVFYIEQATLQSYVSSGILMDITDEVAESGVDLDNIWQYGVDSYRFDGTVQGTPDGALYGLPKDVGPFSFGYNKTMLEEAGIELPDPDEPLTWEEFVEICKTLTTDTDGDGAVDQWGTGLNVQWNLQSMVWSNGGDWTNADHTQVTVDTPEFAEALQKFADLTNVDQVTPSASDAATLDTYQRWMAGEIGFFPVGPWDVSVYNDLDFEYDLIPWPTVGDAGSATWLGSLGIGVSAMTEHPQEAVNLVTYLSADAEAQQTLVDANIQVPNLIDVAEEWAAAEDAEPANRQEFLDIAQDYGRAMPAAFTYGAEWYDELWTNIQPVLDGEQTAEDYLAETQPKMQALLDESLANAEMAAGG